MKLVIQLQYGSAYALPAELAGVIVPAMSQAVLVSKGYGAAERYKPQQDATPLTFQFEPDEMFEEAPDAFVLVQKRREESEQKYLEEWSKGQKLQTRIKELESELASIRKVVAPEPPAPAPGPPVQSQTDTEEPW